MIQDGISLSNFIEVHRGRVIICLIKMNLFQPDIGYIPVIRISFYYQLAVGPPGFYSEGAGGHDVGRFGPVRTILLNHLARNDAEELMGQQSHKEWGRLRQRDPHRIIVDRLNTDVFGAYRYKIFSRNCRLKFWVCREQFGASFFIARQSQARR